MKPSKLFLSVFLLLFFITFIAKAQTKAGKIEVIADAKVSVLVEKHLEINKTKKYIQGFRIHIFSESGSNSKTAALDVKTKFLTKYPSVGAYIVFQEPNYKIRVGDFRTRMNARGFLKDVIGEYPNAYVIKDIIEFPQDF